MNKRNYISAFSVMESVVSMVVSAIVIGVIFVIFTILSERMLDFKNQNQYVADLNRMTYSFNKDIFESDKMIVNENAILFLSYSKDTTLYNIETDADYFLRSKKEFIDTFRIPIKQMKVDTVQNKSKKAVFQRIVINVMVNSEPMQLKFFKKVYSNELLKKEFKNP